MDIAITYASTNYSWLHNITKGRSSDSEINTPFRLLGIANDI